MIHVRCMGHIGTALGSKELEVESDGMLASELVEHLRARCRTDPGFNVYNTLVLVEDSDAFVPALQKRHVGPGDNVVLIPFSHGG